MGEEETDTTEPEQQNMDLEKRRLNHQRLLQGAKVQIQKLLVDKKDTDAEPRKQVPANTRIQ